MGKFDGILIVTDLDGTLYSDDKTVSAENKAAIEYFKKEGGYFTFITGRLPYYSQQAYKAIEPNAPFGCINGGGVYDGAAGEYRWYCTLPSEAVELVGVIERTFPRMGIQLCTPHRTYFAKDNERTAGFRRATGLPHWICPYDQVKEPVAKVLFCSDDEEELLAVGETLQAHPLGEKFSFVRSEKTLYEILPKGVQKGLALGKLTDLLGLDPKNTIAVGDYDNDVGMFLAAGLGVAVANASPKAKAAAKHHLAASNQEHAIARLVEQLEQGKLPW